MINDQWICSSPRLNVCAAPKRIALDNVELSGSDNDLANFGRGLYSKTALRDSMKVAEGPQVRRAINYQLANSVSGGGPVRFNLFTSFNAESLQEMSSYLTLHGLYNYVMNNASKTTLYWMTANLVCLGGGLIVTILYKLMTKGFTTQNLLFIFNLVFNTVFFGIVMVPG